MRQRDAERAAHYEQWEFDICFEHGADRRDRRKSWSFGLRPDEEHADYEPYRTLTGYVHADGTVEGLY